ncbi:putative SWI/SNF-related actin-dependent regulator chromatin subfamily A member 3-like 1 [Ceratocystis fimbriata CBS 114723]|uniref:Putative SWI/SNF-related actin-dependent regulator chromatin subfamily A member 3-like 1 n=1 Tax=Ceratocystis fimbriata CBS 114723 TaxID=1035309 RepID=A0A2C5X9Z1_9PEZI|nr:putative SWI/SNF-related actin-dependent regulator chromatin subfamily A member 3-like 1 [Ceratocystis fimbriata CBS 114723]
MDMELNPGSYHDDGVLNRMSTMSHTPHMAMVQNMLPKPIPQSVQFGQPPPPLQQTLQSPHSSVESSVEPAFSGLPSTSLLPIQSQAQPQLPVAMAGGFNIDFVHRQQPSLPTHTALGSGSMPLSSLHPLASPAMAQSNIVPTDQVHSFDSSSSSTFDTSNTYVAAHSLQNQTLAQAHSHHQHQSQQPPPSRTTSSSHAHAHLKEAGFIPTSLPPIKSGQVFQIHDDDSNSPTESTPPPPTIANSHHFFSPEPNASSFHTVRSEPSFTRMSSIMEEVQRSSTDDLEVDPPQKKRRVDSGVSIARPASSGQSRIFANSLASLDSTAARQPPSSTTDLSAPTTVDLTSHDDDDVQVYNPRDEEVCFGCIEGILHCTVVPSPKPGAQCLFGPNWFPAVKIMLKKISGDGTSLIQAYDHTRQIVGRLDSNTAKALAPLLDSKLNIRADCRINSRQKAPNEVAGQPLERNNQLQLNIYGPTHCLNYIGQYLQSKHIVLRPPQFVLPGIKVMNPHKAVPKPQVRPPIRSYSLTTQPAYQSIGTRSVEEVRTEVQGIFDTLKSNNLPEAEPSDIVVTPLLKHQKQGLHFMQIREQDDLNTDAPLWPLSKDRKGQQCFRNVLTGDLCRKPPVTRGGILADMMGLGKTLSILSLISGSLPESQAWHILSPVQPQQPVSKANNIKTWAPQAAALGLTTLVRNTRATLLVCPLSTITNWEEQIKTHIKPNGLTYYIYHGSNRIKEIEKLADYDLVLTTYGSISSELSARSKGKQGIYPLEELGWFRIVLDEAHMIREQTTLQFKAICRLQANRRWAVTGTPVQNRLDDFAALLQFIRLRPFDDRGRFNRFIVDPFKLCDPNIVPKLRVLVDTVTLRRFKDKINLPKRTDQIVKLDFTDEERLLYELFAKNAQDRVQALSAGGEKALSGHTYIHILRSILRLRLICAHGRDLLNEEDLRVMQGMTADMAIDLDSDDQDAMVTEITERKAHEMFELMQETNNDSCVTCTKKLGVDENAADEAEGDLLGYMNPCFHLICRACIRSFRQAADAQLNGATRGPCHVCSSVVAPSLVSLRKSALSLEHDGSKATASTGAGTNSNPSASANSIGLAQTASEKRAERIQAYRGPSTKVRALLEDLLKSKADSATALAVGEAPFKSVVFSGWTTHLDLIQLALDNAGLKYVRLDGTMSRTARTAAMEAFREDASVDVILVSIMAGGLGLNLTAGNSVYVMEPQYNPAAEAQAIDRVHRLGQTRPVRTVRYIMRDSFEEKMLELQDKKMKLASLSMDGRDKAMDRGEAALQKLRDIRSLFR